MSSNPTPAVIEHQKEANGHAVPEPEDYEQAEAVEEAELKHNGNESNQKIQEEKRAEEGKRDHKRHPSSSAVEPELSAFKDLNPINPNGPDSLPQESTGLGLPGLKRPSSPIDPPPAFHDPQYAATQSPAINRPPKSPGDYLGPYFQFVTTKGDRWLGSILLFRGVGLEKPILQLKPGKKTDVAEPQWELLYDDIFSMRAWRVNLDIQMLPGAGDNALAWTVTWPHAAPQDAFVEEGAIAIANLGAKWRGGFLSCNGFDATVPVDLAQSLTYTNVWKHLGSVHAERPFHLLIWGGDQNYIDFIFEDVPFLKRWTEMEWNVRWKHEFSAKTEEEVGRYHFNTYCENWERPEVKVALANVPALMSWDDHDIFDGAGSYPPLLHESPVMTGLFLCAQRFRLLFQHHTTPSLARKHSLFGRKGHNFLSQCGPSLAILLTDGRTERTTNSIHDKDTWDQIFTKLDTQLEAHTQHLLAVFAVPLSFIRVRFAEHLFDFLMKLPNKYRQLPGVRGTNSLFGLPELYDDLLDEWTHDAHIAERNAALRRLQQFAAKHAVRVTLMSGDVHCCGLSRFRSTPRGIAPVNDARMMYQVISSAIVNMPPPKMGLKIAQRFFKTKWRPFEETEEEFLNVFERLPEGGRKLRHRKLLPNRNWTYWEMVATEAPVTSDGDADAEDAEKVKRNGAAEAKARENGDGTPDVTQAGAPKGHWFPADDFWRKHFAFTKNDPYPTTLGPSSSESGRGSQHGRLHTHSGGLFCRHEKGFVSQKSAVKEGGVVGSGMDGDLRIRIWAESSLKSDKGRRFASYEVVVPPVELL